MPSTNLQTRLLALPKLHLESSDFFEEMSKLKFPCLKHLDISNIFSPEFCDYDACGGGYGGGYGSDDDESQFLRGGEVADGDASNPFKEGGQYPYNKPLIDFLILSCPSSITRLDIGCGDFESKRYLHQYSLSRDAFFFIQGNINENLNVTMSGSYSPLPHEYPSHAIKHASVNKVKRQIMTEFGMDEEEVEDMIAMLEMEDEED
jgi:hypothetical protein